MNRSAPMACGPNVDQARRSRGQRRAAPRTLPGKADPRRLPRQASPAGNRLARGSPGGVWARNIPLYRRVVPGHRHGGTQAALLLKLAARCSVGNWMLGVWGGEIRSPRLGVPAAVLTAAGAA
jgi:hypothetical protein